MKWKERQAKKKKMCYLQETAIGNKNLIPLSSLGESMHVTQSYLTGKVRI